MLQVVEMGQLVQAKSQGPAAFFLHNQAGTEGKMSPKYESVPHDKQDAAVVTRDLNTASL